MSHTGTGTSGFIYGMVSAVSKWVRLANVYGGAGAVSASVATGETRTIPTEHDIVVVDRYVLHGTGALILEGDTQLKVI